MNKTCKYCPYCDLVIAKQAELEGMLKAMLGKKALAEGDYCVLGTQDKSSWRKGVKDGFAERFEGVTPFKNVWKFDVQPAGWYYGGKNRGGERK